MNRQILLAFVPVLHSGYTNFFRGHEGSELFLIPPELYGKLEHLTREIRALPVSEMKIAIKAFGIFSKVGIASEFALWNLPDDTKVVMPDEDISRSVAETYLDKDQVTFEEVFLRYDMPKTMSKVPVIPNLKISKDDFDKRIMGMAFQESRRSPDWWRQVGAVLVKDRRIYALSYNKHMPSNHVLYALGDPRGNFSPGEHMEISKAFHSESSIISKAAANGISTKGASVYVTTFPCPTCAMSLAGAEIAELYFAEGYSSVGAQEILGTAGVKIIQVKM